MNPNFRVTTEFSLHGFDARYSNGFWEVFKDGACVEWEPSPYRDTADAVKAIDRARIAQEEPSHV